MPRITVHNYRRTKVADDNELIIIEHDFCYHCANSRSCFRRDNLVQAAAQQELGVIVTRCPDFEEA